MDAPLLQREIGEGFNDMLLEPVKARCDALNLGVEVLVLVIVLRDLVGTLEGHEVVLHHGADALFEVSTVHIDSLLEVLDLDLSIE